MSDALIPISIDPNQANTSFVSPAPGEASTAMGNFDSTALKMTPPAGPLNTDIAIATTQPTGTEGTDGHASGSMAIAASNGAQPAIDFQAIGNGTKTPEEFYTCGVALYKTSTAGGTTVGKTDFARNSSSQGTLALPGRRLPTSAMAGSPAGRPSAASCALSR